jgi:hypothetical protein
MKAIRLKEKGKEPIVFNTIIKLAEYWSISPARASSILSVLKEYHVLMERFNIETIKECDEFKIPQHYIDKGYKRIDIPGKLIYLANKEGKIICAVDDREVKPYIDKATGYCKVCLNYRDYTVHRIIAKLFVPNPNNLPVVNHINEIRTDNRVENLEWCSIRDNIIYGNYKEKANANGHHPKKVICSDGINTWEYPSISEAARKTGVSIKCIRLCLNGIRKKSKNIFFSYASD